MKYRNQRVGKYASKREANKAAELAIWQKAGAIRDLEEQVKYVLIPKQDGERAVTYTADFRYTDCKDGQVHVLDSKGVRTQQYVIRRKLMKFIHNITVEEV